MQKQNTANYNCIGRVLELHLRYYFTTKTPIISN